MKSKNLDDEDIYTQKTCSGIFQFSSSLLNSQVSIWKPIRDFMIYLIFQLIQDVNQPFCKKNVTGVNIYSSCPVWKVQKCI